MQPRRERRGLQTPKAGLMRSPFGSTRTSVVLVTLLTLLHLQLEPGHRMMSRGGLVSAALSQFCDLQIIQIELRRTVQGEDAGGRRLTCRGNVTLTSCEGQCASSVAPSVISTVGFVKKCTCCRETKMQLAKIQLPHCVGDDGGYVSHAVHEVVIQEPSRCACQPCRP